jgi:6-pyruvoyltetrahydropterin/6-carboxytetrahydropterin synthase
VAGRIEVKIEAHFCAAHALRHYKGGTEPTHGHNFKVIVSVAGEKLDSAGMLVDFLELKPIIDAEVGRLNYCFLNEAVEEFQDKPGGLSPSAENIASVLFKRIQTRLPKEVNMARVEVFESPGCSATYSE